MFRLYSINWFTLLACSCSEFIVLSKWPGCSVFCLRHSLFCEADTHVPTTRYGITINYRLWDKACLATFIKPSFIRQACVSCLVLLSNNKIQFNLWQFWIYHCGKHYTCRSRWPRGLRRGSAAAHLLGRHFRFPPRASHVSYLVSVACYQVAVSATGRSLICRIPTEYGVFECDIETSMIRMTRPMKPAERYIYIYKLFYCGCDTV